MNNSITASETNHYSNIKAMSGEVPNIVGWDLFYNHEIDKETKKKLQEEGFEVIKLKQKGSVSYKIKLPKAA